MTRQRLKAIEQSYALRHPEERIAGSRQRLDDLACRLTPAGERVLAMAKNRMGRLAGRLESLSPLKVLERGYSVTLRARDEALVRSVQDAPPGELLKTRVKDGTVTSRVLESNIEATEDHRGQN